MTRWVWDLESDGLLDKISKIHCIVLRHVETNEVQTYGPDEIKAAMFTLMNAEEVIGHNIIAYDIPALQKVYPGFEILGKITDTLVLSRLVEANLAEKDSIRHAKDPEKFSKRLTGSHSLKAWGLRLGDYKGDYDGGWENYSQEMLDYCVQDTQVTKVLYKYCMSRGFSEQSIALEHSLAHICDKIGNNGWTFDESKATELYALLAQKRNELQQGLDKLFPPWEITEEFIPKRNNKTLGYEEGVPFIKRKMIEFNPSSRRHIEFCLRQKYAWKPSKFTGTGHAQIDETVLGKLPYPEAKKLAEYFMIDKRVGQLAEGPQAWLKKVDADGKIRHTIVSGGTVSGRAAHRGPNLAQVPKSGLSYGRKCRELFTVPDGWFLTGSDLSGLELRCLAHYLNDGGEYAQQILEGDIHTHNQKAAGLATRDQAKTFIYATMYGGGDALIGKIAKGGAPQGKKLKENFNKNIPAFGLLLQRLKAAHDKRGHLIGLDGRKLFIRSEHKLLSQLLQSSGAITCKKWVELTYNEINRQHQDNAYIVGWIHDEIQVACRTQEIAEDVGHISRRMAQETGSYFETKIPITAEYSVGRTWADTH
jgi:DNA polymerase-1